MSRALLSPNPAGFYHNDCDREGGHDRDREVDRKGERDSDNRFEPPVCLVRREHPLRALAYQK